MRKDVHPSTRKDVSNNEKSYAQQREKMHPTTRKDMASNEKRCALGKKNGDQQHGAAVAAVAATHHPYRSSSFKSVSRAANQAWSYALTTR